MYTRTRRLGTRFISNGVFAGLAEGSVQQCTATLVSSPPAAARIVTAFLFFECAHAACNISSSSMFAVCARWQSDGGNDDDISATATQWGFIAAKGTCIRLAPSRAALGAHIFVNFARRAHRGPLTEVCASVCVFVMCQTRAQELRLTIYAHTHRVCVCCECNCCACVC